MRDRAYSISHSQGGVAVGGLLPAPLAVAVVPTRWNGDRPMGVTAIKRIRNQHSNGYVWIRNRESGTTIHDATGVVDIWIPWARTQTEWEGHRIDIELRAGSRTNFNSYQRLAGWTIFQGVQQDGSDRVRCTSGEYANPAPWIPGVSKVNGDRVLHIRADGTLDLGTDL